MPVPLRVSNIKELDTRSLFTDEDPEQVFDNLKEIGHGSFGSVYYARHRRTNEVVAIKQISYHGKTQNWGDIIHEVKAVQSCNHENLVSFKACYLLKYTAWIVMEYCLGSACDVIEVQKTPLSEEEISEICNGAVSGLNYLHTKGFIHRDVKATNILLTPEGCVKLGDFGSVSMRNPANSFVGTPFWMAPEVILAMEDGQYYCKSDVWSLGITCFELAQRKPPLLHLNAMSALYQIAQNPPPTLDNADRWSKDFQDFVKRCLIKDPDNRPTSRELLNHSFLHIPRTKNILLKLLDRTKHMVSQQESAPFRKATKLLLSPDGRSDSVTDNGDISISEDATDSVNHFEDSPSLERNHTSSNDVLTISRTLADTTIKDHPKSDFSTIKTQRILDRERINNELREQMSGYKRMRRQHQNQLHALDMRLKQEKADLMTKCEREFDVLKHRNEKEVEKQNRDNTANLERKLKPHAQEEKSLKGSFTEYNKKLRKIQKNMYKQSVADQKKIRNSPRHEFPHNQSTSQLLQDQDELSNNNRRQFERQLRLLQRQHLNARHDMEKDQAHKLMMLKSHNCQFEKQMLEKHYESMRLMEEDHLSQMHKLRIQLMTKQHQSEISNQQLYSSNKLKELEKKQNEEKRCQPKNTRNKTLDIEKQLKDTLSIQEKQYKLLREKRTKEVSKEESKRITNELKEEQKQKVEGIRAQYRQRIEDMQTATTSRFHQNQLSEKEQLETELNREFEQLKAYQDGVRKQAEQHRAKEKHELSRHLNQTQQRLLQTIHDMTSNLEAEKKKIENELILRHERGIAEFDLESVSMGISAYSANPSPQFFGMDRHSRMPPSQRSSVIYTSDTSTFAQEISSSSDSETAPPVVPRSTSIVASLQQAHHATGTKL